MNKEFHENRRKVIGGSDVAGILGISPWSKPIDIWRSKKGLSDSIEDTESMYMGRKMEPVIAEIYEEITGEKLFIPAFRYHDTISCLGGHADRLIVGKSKGVEIKTACDNIKGLWGEPGTDQIPAYYLTQCIHYMGLYNFNEWDLIVSIAGKKPVIYTIQRNLEIENHIFEKCQQWWKKHIIDDTPPEIDDSLSYDNYLRSKYKNATLPMIEGDITVSMKMKRLKEINNIISNCNEDKQYLENQLINIIGNAEGIKTEAGTITFRNNKPSHFVDWEAVAYELNVTPETMGKHTREKAGSRVFRFTPAQGN